MVGSGPIVTVNQKGLRQLERLIAEEGPKAKREMRAKLRQLAEPVKDDAQSLAEATIPRIGPKWGKMRVGVTTKAVYVAPRERGIKTRGADPRRRPKFADLMEERAMTPALEKNRAKIEAGAESVLQELADEWNRR